MALKLAELADLCLIEAYLRHQTQPTASPPSVSTLLKQFGVVDAVLCRDVLDYLETNGWIKVLNRSTADRPQIQLTTFGTTTAAAGGSTGIIQRYLQQPDQFIHPPADEAAEP